MREPLAPPNAPATRTTRLRQRVGYPNLILYLNTHHIPPNNNPARVSRPSPLQYLSVRPRRRYHMRIHRQRRIDSAEYLARLLRRGMMRHNLPPMMIRHPPRQRHKRLRRDDFVYQ